MLLFSYQESLFCFLIVSFIILLLRELNYFIIKRVFLFFLSRVVYYFLIIRVLLFQGIGWQLVSTVHRSPLTLCVAPAPWSGYLKHSMDFPQLIPASIERGTAPSLSMRTTRVWGASPAASTSQQEPTGASSSPVVAIATTSRWNTSVFQVGYFFLLCYDHELSVCVCAGEGGGGCGGLHPNCPGSKSQTKYQVDTQTREDEISGLFYFLPTDS